MCLETGEIPQQSVTACEQWQSHCIA